MKKYVLLVLAMLILSSVSAQKNTDANIVGHVVCNGEHIPFANIMIKNTTLGTATDVTGHYILLHIPEGTYTVIAQALGYKPEEKQIEIVTGQTIELNFDLEVDALGLEEVVVTGDRNLKSRKESAVVVSTLTPKALESGYTVNISEGLNYCGGLRMENNCQNCGANQVRMNGLDGSYSQILINSRPIFSGLAGVYALELIPINMIERIEVVRGGGSALYGSNAIAGTINLILKDPVSNNFEIGTTGSLIGVGIDGVNPVPELNVNFNTSIVSSDMRTGMSLYGFSGLKEPFDANGDGFSELSKTRNLTVGAKIYHRFNQKNKITLDYFNITDDRRGGNMFDSPEHVADIAESVNHKINTVALNYDRFYRESDQLSVYASMQNINRDSYYGAEQALNGYGNTKDLSYSAGTQYTMRFEKASLVAGVENTGSILSDNKLAYLDIDNAVIIDSEISSIPYKENTLIANQNMNTIGMYSQYEHKIGLLKLSLGARYDHYQITQKNQNTSQSGNVLSPRANVLVDVTKSLQARASYSQGFRAPQVFDEDLHIETSGSRQVIYRNSDDLTEELSHSISASLDYKERLGNINLSFLAEGFYTILNNPFVNEIGIPDANGLVVYTRKNASAGATITGVNMELTVLPSDKISFRSGFTIQQSIYKEAQEFNERKFLRTPSDYGFFSLDYEPLRQLSISATGTYTGRMLVPYFGVNAADPENGELRESDVFFDLGFKVKYNFKIENSTLQVFAGVKNVFNSYQSDFDLGINRDPSYIYGPNSPRTIYFGMKFGNGLF